MRVSHKAWRPRSPMIPAILGTAGTPWMATTGGLVLSPRPMRSRSMGSNALLHELALEVDWTEMLSVRMPPWWVEEAVDVLRDVAHVVPLRVEFDLELEG